MIEENLEGYAKSQIDKALSYSEGKRQEQGELLANDPLPRACNLAGVDYQTFLKIKAYMPLYTTPQSKQEQGEPVAWWNGKESVVFAHDQIFIPNWTDYYYIPLYTTPQTKKWVGLTEDEMRAIAEWQLSAHRPLIDVIKAVEQALKERNT